MAIPLKNTVLDKIKEVGSLTDEELYKALTKDGHIIAEDRFNKLLLESSDLTSFVNNYFSAHAPKVRV